MKQYHAIFHLDEDSDQKINLVFTNIQNLLTDIGKENIDIELLCNSIGVNALLKKNKSNSLQIRQLAEQSVRFVACANAMKNLKISPSELFETVEIVPAGISELVKKQNVGWAYIRP